MKKLLSILVFLMLSGCGSDSETPTDVPDASSSNDASGQADAGDLGQEPDMTVVDMAADIPATEDLGVDMTASDAGSDASANDAGSDVGIDASSDAGSDGACANGYTETVGVPGEVSACAAATESLNQCDAANACAAGWHVCTASEHRGRYEATEPPAVLDSSLWLAGCVRDGAAPMSPIDSACSDCTGTQSGSDEDVGFSCVNAIRLTSDSLYVGVRAASSCQFVGTDTSGDDAYWSAQPAANTLNGAMCCID